MFFQKKKPKSAPKEKADGRAHYRKRAMKAQRLEATLRVEKWDPLPVELVDLTIRGAGVRVPFASDRNLKIGDVIEIAIGSMMRTEVVTPAKVVNVRPAGESHVRYGLEFVNLGNLYSQLDSFYCRHFNRRRAMRVIPALGRKLPATLIWHGGELRTSVYDLSERGIGLALTRDSAVRVAEFQRFEVRFKLPGTDLELHLAIHAKQRTQLNQHALLGAEFVFEGPRGVKAHVPALREFVERRAAEMAQWEAKSK
jgi:c-di-GMP-binding flagellar brake protein YcgR